MNISGKSHTYVFILSNQDKAIYTPNGIRVALCDGWDELVADVVDLFETDLLEHLDDDEIGDEELCAVLEQLAPGNWCVYSSEEGYLQC